MATERPSQSLGIPCPPQTSLEPKKAEGPLTFEAAHEEVEPGEEDGQDHRGEQQLQLHTPGAQHGGLVGAGR